jgi:N-acetylneuraminate 9-O-acetyltransferase
MYPVYNEIRVFVSAYVWMTGFGNFLYFDKKGDFTVERAVSMWLRINYFPLLLSTCLRVPLELYYVVPLHTTGFFITMATCYLAKVLEQKKTQWTRWHANAVAIAVCCVVHVVFYETPMCNFLKLFSNEYYFRFTSDRYSALIGIISGFFWSKFKAYMQWAYNPLVTSATASTSASISANAGNASPTTSGNGASLTTNNNTAGTHEIEVAAEQLRQKKIHAMYAQRAAGITLMLGWYALFGRITDKYKYNPIHPFIFWMPVAGWLMLRNSSKYLCELHAGVMEWLGRITLETYVLQFHIFMCQDVQHIPVLIPGAGANGYWILKTLNMLVWGCLFLFMSFHARQLTVTTQNTVTDLVSLIRHGPPSSDNEDTQEMAPLDKTTGLDHKTSELNMQQQGGGGDEEEPLSTAPKEIA